MRYQDHCAAMGEQITGYLRLISAADLGTPVPTCPGWDLARLTRHLGSTHRWVTEMVLCGAERKLRFDPFRDSVPEDRAALPGWLADGAAKLLATFRAAEPSRPVWSWGVDHHVRFWPRRLLHEAAVHSADAALAVGGTPVLPVRVAIDGVDEFLGNLPHAAFRPPDFGAVAGAGRSIGLRAADAGTGWRLELRADGFSWRRTGELDSADAVLSAPAAGLYLWAWGRAPATDVSGDAGLLERWRRATRL